MECADQCGGARRFPRIQPAHIPHAQRLIFAARHQAAAMQAVRRHSSDLRRVAAKRREPLGGQTTAARGALSVGSAARCQLEAQLCVS
jgi:hypothetical protein